MSDDHCRYLVIPADDRDAFVVESHPWDKMISDDLDGATPEIVQVGSTPVAMWVRETAATDGYAKNITASVIATLLSNWARPITIVGPAVLTTLIPLGIAPDGHTVVQPEGFRGRQAGDLAAVACDVRQAIAGSDGPFHTTDLDPDWPVKVRAFADRIRARPIADDWPASENRPPTGDPLCRILEQAFPGRQFVPVPLGPGSFPLH